MCNSFDTGATIFYRPPRSRECRGRLRLFSAYSRCLSASTAAATCSEPKTRLTRVKSAEICRSFLFSISGRFLLAGGCLFLPVGLGALQCPGLRQNFLRVGGEIRRQPLHVLHRWGQFFQPPLLYLHLALLFSLDCFRAAISFALCSFL